MDFSESDQGILKTLPRRLTTVKCNQCNFPVQSIVIFKFPVRCTSAYICVSNYDAICGWDQKEFLYKRSALRSQYSE